MGNTKLNTELIESLITNSKEISQIELKISEAIVIFQTVL